MRLVLIGLVCGACTTSEPLTPSVELVGSHIVAADGHLASLALEVRLTGPYEVGGQVKVDDTSFYEVFGDDSNESWVYTPIAAYPSDAHWPADGAITVLGDPGAVAAIPYKCGSANVFITVGAAVEGDHHIEGTSAYVPDVPVECR